MSIVKTTTIVALLLAGVDAMAADSTAPAAATDTAAKPAATEEAKPQKPKACAPVSGSRIRPSLATGCRSAVTPLRTYTQEDILRTGEIDINEALRKIDPIFY